MLEEAIIDFNDGRFRQLRNSLAAALGVLGLILVGVSWWEQRTHRVVTVEQVTQALGMTLVGTLPAAPVEKSVRDGPHELWPNAFHESVAAARTLLLHVARSDSLQVVMVTSAVAGEGKTSLSSQLSASLVRAGPQGPADRLRAETERSRHAAGRSTIAIFVAQYAPQLTPCMAMRFLSISCCVIARSPARARAGARKFR